MTKAQDKIIQN